MEKLILREDKIKILSNVQPDATMNSFAVGAQYKKVGFYEQLKRYTLVKSEKNCKKKN